MSPILWIAYTSFRATGLVTTPQIGTPAGSFTLQHYRVVLHQTSFPRFFANSAIIATSVTLISVVTTILGAYGLSRFRLKGKNALIISIFSTQMFPKVLLLIPLYNLVFAIGLFDTKLGVILAQLILCVPFAVWMLKGCFDGLPVDIEDSARLDGCNLFQMLWRVVLPISAQGIFVAAFYSFVVSWGDYLVVSTLSQGNATYTPTVYADSGAAATELGARAEMGPGGGRHRAYDCAYDYTVRARAALARTRTDRRCHKRVSRACGPSPIPCHDGNPTAGVGCPEQNCRLSAHALYRSPRPRAHVDPPYRIRCSGYG